MAELSQQDIESVLGSYIPIDAEAFETVHAHLQEIGATMLAGSRTTRSKTDFSENKDLIVNILLDRQMKDVLKNNPGSFVGPYVLGNEYIAEGVGIWGFREAA